MFYPDYEDDALCFMIASHDGVKVRDSEENCVVVQLFLAGESVL